MDLLFLDVETTGLNPIRHEIVDIWVQRRHRDLSLVSEAGGLVLPAHPELSDKEALRINGFSPDIWESRGAEPFEAVWSRVSQISQDRNGLTLVGSNPRFDLGFLEAALGGERFRMWRPVSVIDTVDLAQPLKAGGGDQEPLPRGPLRAPRHPRRGTGPHGQGRRAPDRRGVPAAHARASPRGARERVRNRVIPRERLRALNRADPGEEVVADRVCPRSIGITGPCPWVGCRKHLALDITEHGAIMVVIGELEVGDDVWAAAVELVADR